MLDVIDDVERPSDHPAQRSKTLGEGPHLEVGLKFDAKVLGRPSALRAQNSYPVRVIDHHPRAVLLGKLCNLGQVADVAFHRKNAVGDDQLGSFGIGALQELLEVLNVIVTVAAVGAIGEADSINQRSVILPVRKYESVPSEQSRHGRGIGLKA